MRRLHSLVMMAAALAAVCMSPVRADTKIQRIVSPGGIEAWLVSEPSLPLVALNFAFVGGASQDPTDKPGVGYMVSTLLDDGAGEYDTAAFHRKLEDNAAELRFTISQDHFQGSIRLLRERQDETFDLLRLALTQPRFDADAIARIREQILASLRRDSTEPGSIASKAWWEAAFPNHPYGKPTNGSLNSIPTVTAEDLRSYVKRTLSRDGLKVAAVGDIDAATLGRVLDHVFGGLPVTGSQTPVPDVAAQNGGRRIVEQLNVPQAVIRLGGTGIARKDPDFMAAYLVNHVLGGGSFTSRLYDEVREKRGLAYGVSSWLQSMKHSSVFMANTQTQAGSTREALEIIESQIKRIGEEGPTENELVTAKAYLKGSYALNFDTSTKIASILLQNQLDDLGIDYTERRNAMIDGVTVETARRAAKRLAASGLLVTVVGQPKDLTSKPPGG